MSKFICKSCHNYINKIYDSVYSCSFDSTCKMQNFYDSVEMQLNNKKIIVFYYEIYSNIDILYFYPNDDEALNSNLNQDEIEYYKSHCFYKFTNPTSTPIYYYKADFSYVIDNLEKRYFIDNQEGAYDFEHCSVLSNFEKEIKLIESNLLFL